MYHLWFKVTEAQVESIDILSAFFSQSKIWACGLILIYLQTGFLMYFAQYLSSYSSSYSTRHSQGVGNSLVIPKFYHSIHKCVKQFGYSFAFDAPNVWKALPGEICAVPSLVSFRKQPKPTCTLRHTHLSLDYPLFFLW